MDQSESSAPSTFRCCGSKMSMPWRFGDPIEADAAESAVQPQPMHRKTKDAASAKAISA